MGRKSRSQRTRYGNWKRACLKFLEENGESVSGVELIMKVKTRDGRPWENAPSNRAVTQVLKRDDRFQYVGDKPVMGMQGSNYPRAHFIAKKVGE
ncbi:MAG: hypothetical protein Tp1100DCM51572_58 [Prokaryotic dsDNA virus sp.]|jgi:hypothetical protein|nr:MAG: hypothetical protein Tp1100DCM51572_58 [Prokaryotic dsDNA virus sp.]